MTDKPDYYQVLGVSKTATKAEIKTAFQRIAMKNHPDMVKNKKDLTPQQKDEAIEKFKLATEAEKILSDDALRAGYDKYGHKGVENMLAGKGANSGQSYTDAAGPVTRRTYSEDDLMDFFGKAKDRREREEAKTDDGLTAEQRREQARQERIRRRNGGNDAPANSNTASSVPEKGSSANAFHDVAEKVSEASQKLASGVEVPLDKLEKFRESVAEFLGDLDTAIAQAKRNGPRYGR